MQRAWMDRLACPSTGSSYELDPVRVAEDEIIEGFLVSTGDRDVRPIVAGVAVLPRDFRAHMRSQGNVYRRSPMNDPRLGRFLLGCAGTGYVVVPFEEVIGHYRDLASEPPPGYDTTPHPEHVALGALLEHIDASGLGLLVGSGVGRNVFRMGAHLDAALGIDRSVACVRRARNIAVTQEAFFLPAPKGSGLKEIPLAFEALVRDRADFAVGDPDALPLQAATFDVTVLHGSDGLGAWSDGAAAWQEARRVTKPGGWLVWHETLIGVDVPAAAHAASPWSAVRLP